MNVYMSLNSLVIMVVTEGNLLTLRTVPPYTRTFFAQFMTIWEEILSSAIGLQSCLIANVAVVKSSFIMRVSGISLSNFSDTGVTSN